jgi:glycerate dehydrogenase
MTTICILDGHTTNPGDLSWEPLRGLGELEIYERTPLEAVIERAQGAEVLVTNKTPIDAEILSALSEVRFVSVLATGYDVVDLEAANRRGIPVSNVPEYSTNSVAEHVFGLMLELVRGVGEHARDVDDGAWEAAEDFTFWNRPIRELKGKTLGIVGWGRIGRRVGELAHAFGMEVIASESTSNPAPEWSGFEFADTDAVVRRADLLTLHCPLTDETRGLIDAERLDAMKPSARLINTSRGPVVDEAALRDALNRGDIAAAAVDVVSSEPIEGDNPLLDADNCLITPHNAWTSIEARQRLVETTADNIRSALDGEPINVVNEPVMNEPRNR